MTSTLPVWLIERIKLGGKKALLVTCPRCDNTAMVYPLWLSDKTNRYATRTCTYCFKSAILPGREQELE